MTTTQGRNFQPLDNIQFAPALHRRNRLKPGLGPASWNLIEGLVRCLIMRTVSASQSSNPFVGRSILIVQKQWLVARGLALAFEAKGARALLARDAAVGLELSNYPDLAAAVLDSDSAQLWRFLNEKKIPCVVYSGSEQIDDEWAGATVIRKPASANEVVGSVERMLGPRDHAP